MKNKNQILSIDRTKHIVTTDMPFVNFDSPYVKEQIEKMNQILKKMKSASSLEV